jgi:hypothetical protein
MAVPYDENESVPISLKKCPFRYFFWSPAEFCNPLTGDSGWWETVAAVRRTGIHGSPSRSLTGFRMIVRGLCPQGCGSAETG